MLEVEVLFFQTQDRSAAYQYVAVPRGFANTSELRAMEAGLLCRPNQQLYTSLWGKSEMEPTGQVRGLSATIQALARLDVPILLAGGLMDQATPRALDSYAQLIGQWRPRKCVSTQSSLQDCREAASRLFEFEMPRTW